MAEAVGVVGMSGIVRLPARDRTRDIRREQRLGNYAKSQRFTAPLSPTVPRAKVEEPLACLQKITSTEQEEKAGDATITMRTGILATHAADGSEFLFYTHQLRGIELVEREKVEAFILHYCTGAGKTIIAAGIIACAYIKLKQFGKEADMKIVISCPPVLRDQWKFVLTQWLTIDPGYILAVESSEHLNHDAIHQAKIILLTRTLLSMQFELAFEKLSSGVWRRKEGSDLPPIFKFNFDRMIVDEIHTMKNPDLPWCECHAELAKNCEKRVGMSATLIQSSMSDMAGVCKTIGMPARFCQEEAWTDGERGVVNLGTVEAFKPYKDELPPHVLGLAHPKYETVYYLPTLDAATIARYNRIIKNGQRIRVGDGPDDDTKKQKLAQLSAAVRYLQHVTVSPRLTDGPVDQLHKAPERIVEVAAHDGGALEACVKLLARVRERNDGGRVIVTSAYTIHLKVLQAYLAVHAPSELVFYFDGSTTDRGAVIHNFLDDENPRGILLLSLQAGGTGIDCMVKKSATRTMENVGCTSIVFFGSRQYNAALEKQAVGRIWRIGQSREVHVYHLLVQGGVDEAIGKVQDEKDALAKGVSVDSTLTATSGLHVWKHRGSVLRDCRPLDADGKAILATEGEKRVRAATDALSKTKAPRVGKLRQAPEEEKFDLAV